MQAARQEPNLSNNSTATERERFIFKTPETIGPPDRLARSGGPGDIFVKRYAAPGAEMSPTNTSQAFFSSLRNCETRPGLRLNFRAVV